MTTASGAIDTEQGQSFLRSRLGSFLAVMPLGIWTLSHLWDNLAAFQGGARWQEAVTHHAHPLSQLFTSVLVLLPLALHSIWGIGRLFSWRKSATNVAKYTFFANLKYTLQRLSAIGLLLFLGAHLWKAFLEPRLVKGHAEDFADIAGEMNHHGPTLAVYLLGTLAVSYHLANGISTFAMGWGLVGSRHALKKLEWLTYGLFVVFLSMAWLAIFALWSAGRA